MCMYLKLPSPLLQCSGNKGLRYEELPGEWFDYNKAFPTVTDFYGSSSANLSPSPTPTPSETVDGDTSPSSMDTTKMAEGKDKGLFLVQFCFVITEDYYYTTSTQCYNVLFSSAPDCYQSSLNLSVLSWSSHSSLKGLQATKSSHYSQVSV